MADLSLSQLLGTIPVDGSGDYAFDSGLDQLKKRIFRRLVVRPGSFPAIPQYGVGVLQFGKQLSTVGVRRRIADEAERQISSEPEVASCSVVAQTDPDNPSVTVFSIYVQTVTGLETTFSFPFKQVP